MTEPEEDPRTPEPPLSPEVPRPPDPDIDLDHTDDAVVPDEQDVNPDAGTTEPPD